MYAKNKMMFVIEKATAHFEFEGDVGENKEYVWLMNENVHIARIKAVLGSR